jgi:CheY-like chemotaxis protein
MSHDIRTPLNAIIGYTTLANGEGVTLEEKSGYIDKIGIAGRQLLGIVNDVLDMSRIESGKFSLEPTCVNLENCVQEAGDLVRTQLEAKKIALSVSCDVSHPWVLCDKVMLDRALMNLLCNAGKFTGENGSVSLQLKELTTEAETGRYEIRVRDTGIGIREKDIEKLFHAFERIEEERNRSIEGTGLGMNITQRLLALMDSQLQVKSKYGEGSVFSFKVKQQVLNWSPMGDYETAYQRSMLHKEAYKESFIAPEARLLIVDDTSMNLTVAKGLLKATQVQIDTALSGYECLEKVREEHYDLILLDHRMPGIDGVETLASMRAMEKVPEMLASIGFCMFFLKVSMSAKTLATNRMPSRAEMMPNTMRMPSP